MAIRISQRFSTVVVCVWLAWAAGPAVRSQGGPGPAPAVQSGRTLKIGVIGPLSGSNRLAGTTQLHAVELAAEEYNRIGGIHGMPVEVLAEDDEGLPEQSRAGVESMLRAGAVAIVGPINSSCTLAVMDLCARSGVPLLTASSTATKITSQGNRWVFRCIESDFFRMAAVSEYLVEELGLRRIGILYDDDDFGRGLHADFSRCLEKYDLELRYAHPFKRDQATFHPEIETIRQMKLEALGLFGITPDNVRIAGEIHRSGLGVQLFSPDVNDRYLGGQTHGLEGLIATDSYYLAKDKPLSRSFHRLYSERFQESPGTHAGRAYDAASILLQAMRRAAEPRGEALREALFATENFPGVTGDFNFKSNGDVVKKIDILSIQNGRPVAAREWRVSHDYRRWLLVLVPALLGMFILVNWLVGRIRRHLRRRVQERALREFKPIRVNPYIVGNPVREKAMFFGREDDFHFIRKNLDRKESGVCVVLCGERRSGKTSILYQVLNERLGPDVVPLLIDLQLYGNAADSDTFFGRLGRDMQDGLRKRGISLQPPPAGGGREILEGLLEGAARRIGSRKMALLLDEYEILESLIDGGALHPSVIDFLSAMLDRHPNLNFILTGSTRLEERKKPYWQHLISKSLYRKISFLTSRDTLRLITEPLKGVILHADGVPERIFRLTAGQPFYTQAICMNIVDHLNEVGHNLVTPEDLAEVVSQLLENPLPQMLYFWDSFSFEEKMALSLLADRLTSTGDEFAEAESLLAHARDLQLSLQPDLQALMTALEGLFSREVVSRKGHQFQFRIDLLRVWIQRDHSPWQILSESR